MTIESAREISNLTAQIKSILDGYPFGVAILRELLQNSDDAGATTQTFILDRRTHPSQSLVDPSLAVCQGPALLAVNNSVFRDSDWTALRTIHGSNKKSNESMTGKYGLGFRATYHLTDNPHVLSGDRLYITDPHQRFQSPHDGGVFLRLGQDLQETYGDHIEAFKAANIDGDQHYVGCTVVRLPLRNPDQAQSSEISNNATSVEDINTLFDTFISDELDITLLFLKHIREVELIEVQEDGIRVLLGRALLKKRPNNSTEGVHFSSQAFLASYLTESLTQSTRSSTWRIYNRKYKRSYASKVLSSRLGREAKELEKELEQDKLVAEVGMAYCLDPDRSNTGRLFTLLPLPQSISPKIPIHLNCNFALTSDRQHLKNIDHLNDQATQGHRESLLAHWNKAIFDEIVPGAWAELLKILASDLKTRDLDAIWSAFPLEVVALGSRKTYWEGLLKAIVSHILEDGLEVFPKVRGTRAIALKGAYLIGPAESSRLKDIVARLGIPIVSPPPIFYDLLRNQFKRPVIDADSLTKELRTRIPSLKELANDDKHAIAAYLLSSFSRKPEALAGLPLIPLVSGKWVALELSSAGKPLPRIHCTQGLDDDAISAWTNLGIPFLNRRISYRSIQGFCSSLSTNASSFIENIDTSAIHRLESNDWNVIRHSLESIRDAQALDDNSLTIYKRFPIFPGPIRANYRFVQEVPLCHIPVLPDITFIESQVGLGLRRLLGSLSSRALEEVDLLRMSLDNWDRQPPRLRERFIPRILVRLSEMPAYVGRLRRLPFITIGEHNLPPQEVVDPDSPLAELYAADDLPTGSFSKGSPSLRLCRNHDLLCNTLTAERLRNRIHFIADNPDSSLPKAMRLLDILDKSWDSSFDEVIDECMTTSWVPTHNQTLGRPDLCFFDDCRNNRASKERFGQPIAPNISQSLARKLRISFLSELLMNQDEENGDSDGDSDDGSDSEGDEEAMRVDLLPRIRTVLHDYDVNYAINEFLANACDAGATKVVMTLDEPGYLVDQNEDLLVIPSFTELFYGPGIIVHNDAKFTEEDFKGILQIDRGGKLERGGVIGRYGLGALSLFHFTDVVTILSGEYVLFMDPIGEYLPRTRNGRKRTAFKRTITSLLSAFPSQLKPFDGMCDYDSTRSPSFYDGTMFWLPLSCSSVLSTKQQPMGFEACHELLMQYKDLACDAFFFTELVDIKAQIRIVNAGVDILWHVSAKMRPHHEGDIRMRKLTIIPDKQEWITAQLNLQIPDELNNKRPYRLEIQDTFSIQMAFPIKNAPKERYLFSTLRLPCLISSPCHLSAPFSLPSSRRGIHFDPSIDEDTEWNPWILLEAFPRLWLPSLATLKKDYPLRLHNFFPKDAIQDGISRKILQGFYRHFLGSELDLVLTIGGEWKPCKDAIFLSELPTGIWRGAIEKFLRHIQPDGVVLLPHSILKHLELVPYEEAPSQMEKPQVVSATIFQQIVETHSSDIEDLYERGDLDAKEIEAVLQLLLCGKVPVSTFPLLLTGCKTPILRQFPTDTCVFYTDDDRLRSVLASFVSPEHLLHQCVSKWCVQMMSEWSPPLVVKFDPQQAVTLIKRHLHKLPVANHSRDTVRWIQRFWELLGLLEGPHNITEIGDYPVIPTKVAGKYVSVGDSLLPYDQEEISPELLKALHQFGFNLVDMQPQLRAILGQEFPVRLTIPRLIQGLQALGMTGSKFPTIAGHKEVATWIRSAFRCDSECDSVLGTLRDLPIWPSMHDSSSLYSSRNGYSLPDVVYHLDATILRDYWEGSSGIFPREYRKKVNHLTKNPLTSNILLSHLSLPTTLPNSILKKYGDFVEDICSFSDFQAGTSIRLPDGTGQLHSVGELYDSTVPLFLYAFRSDKRTKFIHSSIRSQLESNRKLGLIRTVDTNTLLKCLRGVHSLVEDSNGAGRCIIQQAQQVYDQFTAHAPSLCRSRYHRLYHSHVDPLRFIVRSEQQSPHENLNVDLSEDAFLAQNLPCIVTPSQMVRPEYESIAWTQRGRFDFTPPRELLSSIPAFGKPTTTDVFLLHDIRETYEWLNSQAMNSDEDNIRDQLHSYSTEKLFLNVDDPGTSGKEWVWNSATELIMNLPVDQEEHRVFGVRQFLRQYRLLLSLAGSEEMKGASYSTTDTEQVCPLPPGFEQLRGNRQSTDMVMAPTERGAIHIQEPNLYFHKVVLEAMVPHFRESIQSGMCESNNNSGNEPREYIFYGTPFGAVKLLEFVYTNKIKIEKEHLTHRNSLQEELLQLLSPADQWGFKPLKREIGRLLVEVLKFLDFSTVKHFQREAERYNAEDLLRTCCDFEQSNAEAIIRWEARERA
ncbi:hypothetical protein AX16_006307 [Volvariella volvacea WC 439]|nr:hypothetical protein AX16_006307 [Volvariella volvacea WC 439]